MRDAEVDEAEGAGALGDEQVGRLHVAMDDAALVRMAEPGAQLRQPVDFTSEWHLLAAPNQLRHRPAGDELHGQVRIAFVFADGVDADNVGVMHLGREPRLAQEAPTRLVVGHPKDLDGDGPVEHRVEAQIHDTHTAMAEAVPHFIRADMSRKLVHAGVQPYFNRSPRLSVHESGARLDLRRPLQLFSHTRRSVRPKVHP